MNRPRPSAFTLGAVLRSCGKTITCAAIPKGDWLEYRAEVHGYDVSQLLLVFADDSSLLLWSEMVRYGTEPWQESFVLHAESQPPSTESLGRTNPGASCGFSRAPPIDQLFAGQELANPELFVDLTGACVANEEDYLPSDSLRLQVGEESVEMLTEGQCVLPLSLVLRSRAFPVFNTKATGQRNWFSFQQLAASRHERSPDSDA